MTITRSAIDAIGYAAATMTTISFVPQLLHVLRRRSAKDVSLGMFLIFSAGTSSWLVYGLLVHSRPVVVANAVTTLLALAILVLKLRFDVLEAPVLANSADDRIGPNPASILDQEKESQR